MTEQDTLCELCGEPMPPGEEMFSYHGYSGPCSKPPKPTPPTPPPASEDEPSDHDWRDVATLARRALAFGHQATPQTPERMIERKEEALRAIVTVCERHGAGSSVLRAEGGGDR